MLSVHLKISGHYLDGGSVRLKMGLPLTGIGEKPYWVTSDASGEHCYVSWSGTDQMSVISYATGEEVARVDVGDHPQRIREGFVPANWVQ